MALTRGVELRGVVVTIFVAVLEYLSFADIENLFYAVVGGEITSTSPSTGASSGVLP